jgi:aconitate hydratase
VRDLAGRPVSQVILGGDGGATLRDLFAVAALLKSKRVPPRLDFLFAAPSRQALEVLSSSGALTDLLACGARLVEPDTRVVEGAMYPPPRSDGGTSVRTSDPELPARSAPCVVASAETLAYAVATGEIGDPRSFKRPVRVTVPRDLPTDDVLILRERKPAARKAAASAPRATLVTPAHVPWRGPLALDVVPAAAFLSRASTNGAPGARVAVLCTSLDEVRTVAACAQGDAHVGAVLASFIPSGVVALLSGLGVAALEIDASSAKALEGAEAARSIALPPPTQWRERQQTLVAMGPSQLSLTWLALGVERDWAAVGTAGPGDPSAKGHARPRAT